MNMNNNQILEYELLEISFQLQYELDEKIKPTIVADGSNDEHKETNEIEYDENGIPKGKSVEEIRLREKRIFEFYERWKNEHPNKAVFNKALNADILIRQESVIEAAQHSSKRYLSTLAVFHLDELLECATLVTEDSVKADNKNQAKLQKMLLMEYDLKDIGKIKLTVGVRRKSEDKIQYGITALNPDEKIEPKVEKTKKKASHRRR